MSRPPEPSETTGDHTDDEERDGVGVVLAPCEYLHVVLEARRPLAGGARFALDGIDEVVAVRGSARRATRERTDGVNRLVLRLPGRLVSTVHARLHRERTGWRLEDAGSTNGSRVNGGRIASAAIREDDVIEIGRTFLTLHSTNLPLDEPSSDLDSSDVQASPVGFATLLPELARALRDLRRVAESSICVVLSGESGTGKEVLARAVHELSQRSGPFVAVNCGALTETLAESQLFGHVRGAFSGAVKDAPGFVRAAHGGTLLLDEVNDLDRSAQAALLRVLQEREVVPVGSARPQPIDVRFLTTSPEPLERVVQSGRFRADLFARLSGFTHKLPPLRRRREDLGVLVASLLEKLGVTDSDSPELAPELALRLLQHDWPLNVRELEQRLRRAWVLARGQVLSAHHAFSEDGAEDEESTVERVLSPDEVELRRTLIAALERAGGNVAAAARELGKAPTQIYRWMKRLGIDLGGFRGE